MEAVTCGWSNGCRARARRIQYMDVSVEAEARYVDAVEEYSNVSPQSLLHNPGPSAHPRNVTWGHILCRREKQAGQRVPYLGSHIAES